ncbi:peptidylprolyl isomerase [Limnovirga soli]|uniref:peptidylprolyl isomerase n=1 Tax=Limnovirga soli TaxID=2656915 RepID=A0A8J8FCM8_9BACT|nr:peptidylprolyl isomerase [Limnovirga soli]NNV54113.1 hypothetical protein [Limnovirga soli]
MKLFNLTILLFLYIGILSAQNKSSNVKNENVIKLTTNKGIVLIKLYDGTPLHRDNFLNLVNKGFYNGLTFHRIIKGFMIQGGDPKSKNATNETILGESSNDTVRIPAELKLEYFHKRGALVAARDFNPEKASDPYQFYIVQGKIYTDSEIDKIESQNSIKYTQEQRDIYKNVGGTPLLDQKFTVFGEVIGGYEVIEKIANSPTNGDNKPSIAITMKMEISSFSSNSELSRLNKNPEFNKIEFSEVQNFKIDDYVYSGRVKGRNPDGHGKWTKSDGTWYEGEFKDGIENGIGTLRQPNGLRYTGNFTNGLPNGQFKIERWTLMGIAKDEWTAIYNDGELVSSSQTETGMTDFLNSKPTTSSSSTKQENNSNKTIKEIPTVKKIEFEQTKSSFVMGESEKYYVTFSDGTTGYLFFSKKYSQWYINDGATNFGYDSKDNALSALYEYKDKGTIRKTGRK